MLLRLMFLEPPPTARHDVLFTCCCASCFWNCFRSWPERLEPSPAARTRIFKENLSLPDSGWPRFVCMFDFSSGTPSLGWWDPVSRPRFCKLEIDIEAKNVLDRAARFRRAVSTQVCGSQSNEPSASRPSSKPRWRQLLLQVVA